MLTAEGRCTRVRAVMVAASLWLLCIALPGEGCDACSCPCLLRMQCNVTSSGMWLDACAACKPEDPSFCVKVWRCMGSRPLCGEPDNMTTAHALDHMNMRFHCLRPPARKSLSLACLTPV